MARAPQPRCYAQPQDEAEPAGQNQDVHVDAGSGDAPHQDQEQANPQYQEQVPNLQIQGLEQQAGHHVPDKAPPGNQLIDHRAAAIGGARGNVQLLASMPTVGCKGESP